MGLFQHIPAALPHRTEASSFWLGSSLARLLSAGQLLAAIMDRIIICIGDDFLTCQAHFGDHLILKLNKECSQSASQNSAGMTRLNIDHNQQSISYLGCKHRHVSAFKVVSTPNEALSGCHSIMQLPV